MPKYRVPAEGSGVGVDDAYRPTLPVEGIGWTGEYDEESGTYVITTEEQLPGLEPLD